MPAQPRAFYSILRLHQLVHNCLDEALQPVELTAHQYTVLSLVRNMAPTTSALLARRLQISAQSTGETLKGLEARGMVQRGQSPDNKRLVLFTLTTEGRRMALRADRLVNKAEAAFFDCIDASALQSMQASIQTIRSARH
jgi:DNA-binding MarR family transcriptional regulator